MRAAAHALAALFALLAGEKFARADGKGGDPNIASMRVCGGAFACQARFAAYANGSEPAVCTAAEAGAVIYSTTDAGLRFCNGSSWGAVASTSGMVTGAGAPNRLAYWTSSSAIDDLGAGTSTQVLHGNASGAPSFGSVSPSDTTGSTGSGTTFVLSTGPTITAPIVPDSSGAAFAVSSSGRIVASDSLTTPWGGYGALTNYIYGTDDIQSNWTATSCAATANTIVSPTGETNATSLVGSASGAKMTRALGRGSSASVTITFSVWLKAASGSPAVTLQINSGNETGTPSASYTLTTSWQRFYVTQTFTSGSTGDVTVQINVGNQTIHAWGANAGIGSAPAPFVREENNLHPGQISGEAVHGLAVNGDLWLAGSKTNPSTSKIYVTTGGLSVLNVNQSLIFGYNNSTPSTTFGVSGWTNNISGNITAESLTASRAVCTTSGKVLSSSCNSSDIAASVGDETGSGFLVFQTAPTLIGATLGAGDGTVGAPSIAWTSDADGTGTGFYRPAANQVGVAINGAQTALFTATSAAVITGGSTTKAKVGGAIGYSTTQAGNTAGALTTLWSQSLDASLLGTNGDSFELVAAGTFAGTVNTDKNVTVVLGSTTLLNTGSLAITSAADWHLRLTCVRVDSTHAKCVAELESSSSVLVSTTDYVNANETLTNALTLAVKGNGTSASDTVLELAKLEWSPAP